MSTILSHTPTIAHEPIEAGNHLARCISIIDLGTQRELKFQSDEEVQNPKIRIIWELPNETYTYEDKDTKEEHTTCKTIGKEYKASLYEKANLRIALVSWRGGDFTAEELEGFELAKILDKPCMINITHTEKNNKKYANITAITPLPKGMTCPERVKDLVHYNIEDGKNDVYKKLPEFLRTKIDSAIENETTVTTTVDPSTLPDYDLDDIEVDLPF
jgi:hypothetical protein